MTLPLHCLFMLTIGTCLFRVAKRSGRYISRGQAKKKLNTKLSININSNTMSCYCTVTVKSWHCQQQYFTFPGLYKVKRGHWAKFFSHLDVFFPSTFIGVSSLILLHCHSSQCSPYVSWNKGVVWY